MQPPINLCPFQNGNLDFEYNLCLEVCPLVAPKWIFSARISSIFINQEEKAGGSDGGRGGGDAGETGGWVGVLRTGGGGCRCDGWGA